MSLPARTHPLFASASPETPPAPSPHRLERGVEAGVGGSTLRREGADERLAAGPAPAPGAQRNKGGAGLAANLSASADRPLHHYQRAPAVGSNPSAEQGGKTREGDSPHSFFLFFVVVRIVILPNPLAFALIAVEPPSSHKYPS